MSILIVWRVREVINNEVGRYLSLINIIKVAATCASRVPHDMYRPPPEVKKSTPSTRVCRPRHPRESLGRVPQSTDHRWAAPAAAGWRIYGVRSKWSQRTFSAYLSI